jgi:hypothetical protein
VSANSSLKVVGTQNPDAERARLVDEYGELDRQVKQFKPVADRHEAVKAIIKSWYDAEPAEAKGVIQGNRYEVQIGARAKVRSWLSLARVAKAVGGVKVLIRLCTVSIEAVEGKIGKEKTAELLEEDLVGTRRITAVAKVSNQAA